jgi:hypothetical protein
VGTAASNRAISIRLMIDECTWGPWWNHRLTESPKSSVPAPICSSQVPHGLPWEWTRSLYVLHKIPVSLWHPPWIMHSEAVCTPQHLPFPHDSVSVTTAKVTHGHYTSRDSRFLMSARVCICVILCLVWKQTNQLTNKITNLMQQINFWQSNRCSVTQKIVQIL